MRDCNGKTAAQLAYAEAEFECVALIRKHSIS